MKCLLPLLLAVPLLAGPARATTVLRLELPDLVERAGLILEGRVLQTTTGLDDRGLITTTVTLAVDDDLLGRGERTGSVLEFTVPGGERDGKVLLVPGLPRFAEGDELILFLTVESTRGFRMPVGLGQGRYRVVRDPDTGARRLERSLAGLDLVDERGRTVPAADRQELAYRAFKAEIERLVAERR